jgi:uncharacterized RDD family membrane protein YckC
MNPLSSSPLSTLVKADAGQRFLAYLIDGLVVFAFVSILSMAFWMIRMGALGGVIGYGLGLIYTLAKDALPEIGGFLGGQSVGKKLMNIKVVKEDTGASIVGDYGTAVVRQITLFVPFLNFVELFMVFSDSRKRFGDQWAKTIVVKA